MRVWAFIALMIVTVVTVVIAAEVAESWLAPGFERGIFIAVVAGLVVFPLTRWFEHRGWVGGAWQPGADGRPVSERQVSDQEVSDPQVSDDPGSGSPASDRDGSPAAGRLAGSGTAAELDPARSRAAVSVAHEKHPPTGDAR